MPVISRGGFVGTGPFGLTLFIVAIYDRLARFYDRAFAPFERRFLARWREETLSLLPEDAVILEVGCGTGANFRFYPAGCKAFSTELSLRMLEIAVAKAIENKLIQADAQALPFAEDVFDAAFATLVFCSIPNPAQAFAELRRVVKPGGKIILLEHVRPKGMLGRAFDLLNVLTVLLIDDHFNRRTSQLAADSGLRVTEVRERARGAVNLIICENPETGSDSISANQIGEGVSSPQA